MVVVALLALGGCKKGESWKDCAGLYVIDHDKNKNVLEHSVSPGEKATLRYRVVSESPMKIEYHHRQKPGGFHFEEEETGFVVLKPGQQLQCLNY